MKKNSSAFDMFYNASPISKTAGVLFVLGKLNFIPAATVSMIDRSWGIFFIAVYIACIVGAIVLSLLDMFKRKRGDYNDKAPSRKDVEKWAKQYNLI